MNQEHVAQNTFLDPVCLRFKVHQDQCFTMDRRQAEVPGYHCIYAATINCTTHMQNNYSILMLCKESSTYTPFNLANSLFNAISNQV